MSIEDVLLIVLAVGLSIIGVGGIIRVLQEWLYRAPDRKIVIEVHEREEKIDQVFPFEDNPILDEMPDHSGDVNGDVSL